MADWQPPSADFAAPQQDWQPPSGDFQAASPASPAALQGDQPPTPSTPVTPQSLALEKARKVMGLDNPFDNFLSNAEVGVVKAISGMVQASSDGLNALGLKNNIGEKVGNFANAAQSAMVGTHTNAIAQSVGQAIPYVLGGDVFAATKGAGLLARVGAQAAGGGLSGLLNLESGKTPQQRTPQRAIDAAFGATAGAVLGSGAEGGAAFLRKLGNSKALEGVLNNINTTIEDWKPDATEVAKDVGSKFTALSNFYQQRMNRLTSMVDGSGGVDTKPISDSFEDANKLISKVTPADPSKNFLGKVLNSLEDARPIPGKDLPAAQKSLGAALDNPVVRKQMIAQGFKLDPTTKPGRIGPLMQLSADIEQHLDGLGTKVDSQAALALRKIKTGVDTAIKNTLEKSPAAATIAKGLQTHYFDAVKPFRGGLLANILSKEPEDQVRAVSNLLMSGDEKNAELLANTLSSKGKDSVVRIAVHNAIAASFDKTTQHVDASKFSEFFKNPVNSKPLQPFLTPENKKLFESALNFIKHDAHTQPGKGFFGAQAGNLGITLGLYEGVKQLVEGNPEHFAESLMAAAGVKILTKGINALFSSGIGRNFLNATSELKPDTPAYAAAISKWAPRLSRLFAAEFGQQGSQLNSSPSTSIPYPFAQN